MYYTLKAPRFSAYSSKPSNAHKYTYTCRQTYPLGFPLFGRQRNTHFFSSLRHTCLLSLPLPRVHTHNYPFRRCSPSILFLSLSLSLERIYRALARRTRSLSGSFAGRASQVGAHTRVKLCSLAIPKLYARSSSSSSR